MTMTPHPPRLAVALLNRFVSVNEPLIGDLLEEFQAGRTRTWFWGQVCLAIVTSPARHRATDAHPLNLGPLGSPLSWAEPAASTGRLMTTINMSGIPVNGIGGLGLVAIAILTTIVLPEAWWLVLGGVLGGSVVGAAMVMTRRRYGLEGTGDDRPKGLALDHASAADPGLVVVPR
jgi:hypothetical protein